MIETGIVEKVDPTKESVLMCASGRAWNDQQINGTCDKCGENIYWQTTAAKTTHRWCATCVIEKMRADSEEDHQLLVTKRALEEASTITGEDPDKMFREATTNFKRIVEEE